MQPNQDSSGTSSLHGSGGRITNVAVQDICPTDTVEHLGLGTYDTPAYALAIDALAHDGPADPERIPGSVCTQPLMPGTNPLTSPTDAARAAIDVELSPGDTVFHEPPLACYVNAGCPSQARTVPAAASQTVPAGCRAARLLVLPLSGVRRGRVVSFRVYVDGRRVMALRSSVGRARLARPIGDSAHAIVVVERLRDGSTRTHRYRYSACALRSVARR